MTTIPKIKELYDGIIANFDAEYGMNLNPFGRAFLVALAGVLSVVLWTLYLALGDVQRNMWFTTATSVAMGGMLEVFGNEILGRYPYNATAGRYGATATGSMGATIPATSVWRSDDNSESPGKLYRIYNGAHVMAGTSDSITIEALEGGLTARLAPGDTLTTTAPILNMNDTITVAAEVVTPENAETLELYREKIREKIQTRAGSWSAADYRILGTEITGVQNVFAYRDNTLSSTVNVWLQGTVAVAYPGPSASPTVVTNYSTALELVRPLDVWQANVASCPIKDVDITITMGGFPPYTTDQQNLIRTALRQFVNSVRPFIAAADAVSDRNDKIATFNLSDVVTRAVPGYGFSALTFEVASVLTSAWTADNGEVPFMNSVVFV